MNLFKGIVGFEWDDGNFRKNYVKHGITNRECEEVFFSENKKILKDVLHSNNEDRWILLGETVSTEKIFIAFTLREDKIRIISARKLNRKEYKLLI